MCVKEMGRECDMKGEGEEVRRMFEGRRRWEGNMT